MPEDDDILDPEVVDGFDEAASNAHRRSHYKNPYKTAAEYQEDNSFNNLLRDLLGKLEPEDIQRIQASAEMGRQERRSQLTDLLIQQEQAVGDLELARDQLKATQLSLLTVDPTLEKSIAAFNRKADAHRARGKREALKGFNLERFDEGNDGVSVWGINF